MQEFPIDLHADDVDMMDNEEEVAKKVDKPKGKGIQKYGSKTKEAPSKVVVVATNPSPLASTPSPSSHKVTLPPPKPHYPF